MVGFKKELTGLLSLFNMEEATDSFALDRSTIMSTRSFFNPSASRVEPSFMSPSFRGASSSALVTRTNDNLTPLKDTLGTKLGLPASVVTASVITVAALTESFLTGSNVSAGFIAQKVALTLFNTWAGKKLADWTTPLFSTGLKKHVQNMSSKDLSKILNGALRDTTDFEIDIMIKDGKLPGWSKGKIGKLIREGTTSFLPPFVKGFIVKRIILNMEEAKAAQLVRDIPVNISKGIFTKLHVRQAYVYILTNRVLRVMTQCVFSSKLVRLESSWTHNALEKCMNNLLNE